MIINRRLSNLTSLLILLYMTIFTAGMFHAATRVQAFAATWEDQGFAAEVSQSVPLKQKKMIATFDTTLGSFEIELAIGAAPKTVENFVSLARSHFYDGVKFHRVIKGFMIQSGDPLSKGTDESRYGTGGPGYTFADEINSLPMTRGTLAMANAGPNTNGSQFFVITAQETPWLVGKHTVFGKVVSGMEVIDAIEKTPTKVRDIPVTPVVIESITIK